MKKSKILFALLLTSAALVSCGANKTEISFAKAKEIATENSKKEITYTSATVTTKYTKFDLTIPESVLALLGKTQEEFKQEMLSSQGIELNKETKQELTDAAEIQAMRLDVSLFDDEKEAEGVTFYVEKNCLSFTAQYEEEGALIKATAAYNEYNYLTKTEQETKMSMAVGTEKLDMNLGAVISVSYKK